MNDSTEVFNSYPLSPIVVVRELFNHIAPSIGKGAINDDEARAIIHSAIGNRVTIGSAIVTFGIMVDIHIQGNPIGVSVPFGIDVSDYKRRYACEVSDILQPIIDTFNGTIPDVRCIATWQDFNFVSASQ